MNPSHRAHSRRTDKSMKVKDQPPSSSLFTIDTTGDEANINYGSLHKYSVPAYRRSGRGSVLGLPRGEKIDSKLSLENKVVTSSPGDRLAGKSSKKLWPRTSASQGTYIRPETMESLEAHFDEFISLSPYRKRKRRRLNLSPGSDGDVSDDFSSQSSLDSQDEQAPDAGATSMDNGTHAITDDNAKNIEYLRLRAELNRRVESTPTDGDAWMRLIMHHGQDPFAITLDRDRLSLSDAPAGIAEMRASIAQKALKTVKEPSYRESLLRIYMQDGALVWDSTKLSRTWKEVLSKDPQFPLLWMDYLEFLLTKSASFSVSDTRDAFASVFQKLKSIKAPSNPSKASILCNAVLRLALFLKEAGYTELSIAVCQANLELNLFRPPFESRGHGSDTSKEAVLNAFEQFWESEVPRLGEEKSVGWGSSTVHESRAPSPLTDPTLPSASVISISNWYAEERIATASSSMPARTLDEVEPDDPYRVVLFSDIQPFLILVEDGDSRLDLISAFLEFCGIPPLHTRVATRAWWESPFTRNHGLDQMGPAPADPETRHVFSSSCSNYLVDTASAMANNGEWFSPFNGVLLSHHSSWIRKSLKQIYDAGFGGDSLAECYLGLEYTVDAPNSRKLAKSMIKKQPSNLHLYNSFAAIEASFENYSSADKTLAAVIRMSDSPERLMTAWALRIWNFVSKGAFREGLEALLGFPHSPATDSREPTKLAVLSVQKALTDSRNSLLRAASYHHASSAIELLMLFEYLRSDQALDAALASFTSSITFLPDTAQTAPYCELLHQSRSRLLYVHMIKNSLFSPSTIRTALQESISLFPFNTIFLNLFAFVERRFRIDDRIRSTVQSLLTPKSSPDAQSLSFNDRTFILHHFSIDTELSRTPELGSNTHSIRSAFERAVQGSGGRKNAWLWKRYCLFEVGCGEAKRARSILYRAISACPWAKELGLLAFGPLREHMSVQELKGLYETMVDRDIRVRLPLDQALEAIGGS